MKTQQWLVPVLLFVGLAVVADFDLPLQRFAWTGSWLMVAAAIGLVWAVRQRRR